MPKNQAISELFMGVQAVDDAGGFDGFITEVMAEVKTIVMKKARSGGLETVSKVTCATIDASTDVVLRRLQADTDRDYENSVCRALHECGESKSEITAATEQAMAEAEKRHRLRCQVIFQALGV